MNKPIAIVFALNTLAVVAHLIGGTRESLSIAPAQTAQSGSHDAAFRKLRRNWVQAMCAFQMLSVDLMLMSIVLYLLAFTSVLTPARTFALAVVAVYFCWAVAWLIQLLTLRRAPADYLFLGHWLYWLVCASLVYWGSLSL